jgi:hypothetical protein
MPPKTLWTPERDAKLLKMRGEGVPWKIIAKEFGCAWASAEKRWSNIRPREDRKVAKGALELEIALRNSQRKKPVRVGVNRDFLPPLQSISIATIRRGVRGQNFGSKGAEVQYVFPMKVVAPSRTCRFPLGEPKSPNFRFCDDPSAEGRSYCQDHYRVCYSEVRSEGADLAPWVRQGEYLKVAS